MNAEELKNIRSKAKEILKSLEIPDESKENGDDDDNVFYDYNSWIRGKVNISKKAERQNGNESFYPSKRCRYFDKNGFLLVKSFCDDGQINAMKDQMRILVHENWHPNSDDAEEAKNLEKVTVFRTDEKQIDHQGSDDYFLESANKIHFFAESEAIDSNGNLKPEYTNNKMLALNKAGHGLHVTPGAFQTYTQSSEISSLVSELGWEDPVVPQSMYIFKQAIVGGEVTSHQDSTFLYTTPKQSCLGLWLALDDATVENGCLWVRPFSHTEKVRRIFKRNIEHFSEEVIVERSNVAKGDVEKSQMIFEDEKDVNSTIPWDGAIPKVEDEKRSQYDALYNSGFVPIECKAGDLVVFPGELDHLSLPNHSKQQRHTFQLHLVEGEGIGVHWSEYNWLQYPKGMPFLSLQNDRRH